MVYSLNVTVNWVLAEKYSKYVPFHLALGQSLPPTFNDLHLVLHDSKNPLTRLQILLGEVGISTILLNAGKS